MFSTCFFRLLDVALIFPHIVHLTPPGCSFSMYIPKSTTPKNNKIVKPYFMFKKNYNKINFTDLFISVQLWIDWIKSHVLDDCEHVKHDGWDYS